MVNTHFDDIAEYEKHYAEIIDSVSDFQDRIEIVVKNAGDLTALKVIEVSADYGEVVVDVVEACGTESIYEIHHYIIENELSFDVAQALLGKFAKFGSALVRAIGDGGIEHAENIVDIISKLNADQIPQFIALVEKYGSDAVSAVASCGTQNFDLIIQGVKLCGSDGITVRKLLKTLVNHSSAMIKALQKCKRVETIKTYVLIFERFGDNVKEFEDRNLFFEEFRFAGKDDKNYELLEKIINKDSNALCFTYSIKDDGTIDDKFCVVSLAGANSMNPTIRYKPDGTPDYYNHLLTEEGIKDLDLKDKTVNNLKEFIESLDRTQDLADDLKSNYNEDRYNKVHFYSLEKWRVKNCAEVWGAFEMILQGGTFNNLEMYAFFNTDVDRGVYHEPCQNCQVTFVKQYARMLDEGRITTSDLKEIFFEIRKKLGI